MVRLGFLSNHNPLDKSSFSGTSHFMWRALAENPTCSVRVLGGHRSPRHFIDKLWRPAVGPGPLQLSAFDGLDAVLSLVSTDLVTRYGQLTKVPLIHCTDATPGFLRKFYGYEVSNKALEEELLAYERAKLILFSSDFMLRQAVSEFGEGYSSKMAALPWGANLDSFPVAPPSKPPLKPLRLLFIGKEWVRKGGDIVIETLQELKRRGIAAELHLVGTRAGEAGSLENVIDHGFLNKNREEDRHVLEELLNCAHFLVLPTRADCTPMVVAEANSHGIPVLITKVGGIPSLVQTGWNGEMMLPEASAADYADRLMALSKDRAYYEALSRNSFEHFKEHLTWTAWADEMLGIVEEKLVLNGVHTK